MKVFKLFGLPVFSWGEETSPSSLAPPDSRVIGPITSGGRSSQPDFALDSSMLSLLEGQVKLVGKEFSDEVIPVIRKLCYGHPDLSQALDNIVQLGNTGHQIQFSADVNEKEAFKMIQHLDQRRLEWSQGTAGMDGLVNKMVAQVMIGGALSNEWVPEANLKGVKNVIMINPETIHFSYDRSKQEWQAYQKLKNRSLSPAGLDGMVKLNMNTYRYYALNGDQESPYGYPVYLPALGPVTRQSNMFKNIDYIIDQIGVMGFMQVLVEKPDKSGAESEITYLSRLDNYLVDIKQRIHDGIKDGTVVGYKEDYEMEFKSISKDARGVSDMFNLNELQIASAVKQDASLMGRSYGTTETQITVIFTKLLSQIKNIQALVKRNLEFGYSLDLRLAGFNFRALEVKFNQSTVLDELKNQQAMEIKIRNYHDLYYDGIISQEQYATAMGYEKPSEPKPRFIRDNATTEEAIKAETRRKQKNESDVAVRKKNKPQEKTIK